MKEPKRMKVILNGKRLRDMYPHATRFQVFKWRMYRFFRKIFLMAITLFIIWAIFKLGGLANPKEIEIIKEPEVSFPILEKIAQAESMNSHYCTEHLVKAKMCAKSELGQVLIRGNKNGTTDIGKYQINNFYWGAKATELGYNLWKEEDNEQMAMWIYQNYGTEPWVHSKKFWSK